MNHQMAGVKRGIALLPAIFIAVPRFTGLHERRSRMKYQYKTATGNHEIEVDEQFYDALIALDAKEKNSDRKHSRRRPVSLESMDYEGQLFSDGTDILGDLIQMENYERLHTALAGLTPNQQALIKQIYFQGIAPSEIARRDGVNNSAISMRLALAHKKLEKFLK